MRKERRVVVTGVGVVSPLGIGAEAFFSALLSGESALRVIEKYDPTGLPCHIGGEAPPYKIGDYVPKSYRKAAKVMARDIELAVIAADQAFRHAGLQSKAYGDAPQIDGTRFGCNIGAGLVQADLNELAQAMKDCGGDDGTLDLRKWGKDGMSKLTPLWMLKYLPNMLACHVTIVHGLKGPSNTITCADASSHLAIGEALRTIQRGQADLAICGGSECKLVPMGQLRQAMIGRLNVTSNDDPRRAVRPFDADAAGTALGEGGGLLILEELEHAQKRGATILAEVVGFAASQDGHHPYEPSADGRAYRAAIRDAIADAELSPDAVDLIVPHGLGIAAHDRAELATFKGVFGERLAEIALSTPKAQTGNLAAGNGQDVAAAVLALARQVIPPAINTQTPMDGATLNVSPEARQQKVGVAVSSVSSLGGQNSALVLKAYNSDAPPSVDAAIVINEPSVDNPLRGPEADASRRIVITGMGWVTPLGVGLDDVWQALLAGKSGIAPTTIFDASEFPTKFSAEVKGFKLEDHLADISKHATAGRHTRFALAAAAQATTMARLAETQVNPERFGIYLASGEGSLDLDAFTASLLEAWDADASSLDMQKWARAALSRMHAIRELEQEPNSALTHIAMLTGARGPGFNCLTACAASTQAIGEAMQMLRRGDCDVMLSGGAHSMIHPFGVTGFNRLTALSQRNDDPTTASRPFDLSRDGFVLGEGSGMVVLETLEHAQKRNAPIFAELVGYGSTADAYRITDQHPDGEGAIAAMREAMADAGLRPEDVHYINAHGTGTKENDGNETGAIKQTFGEQAYKIPVSSIKSMMGHLIAAAGAVELICCVLALRDQVLPPTINMHNTDHECDLDYVPNEARKARVETALSNSFGFGGQNDTVIIRRF